MTINEPHNLPLDFGVPDEVVLAAAIEGKDYEALGKLYEQGMPMSDTGFAIQDLLLELEDGMALTDPAIKGFAMRIYKTLAMTFLEDDVLSQNAIYQLFRNAMLEEPGVDDPSTRLASALAQLPYVKTGKDTLRGTMFEAAVDILDNTDADPGEQMSFAMRFAEVYPGEIASDSFAAYSCNRFFQDDEVTIDSTVGMAGILTHPSSILAPLSASICKQMGEVSPGKAALRIVLKATEKLRGGDLVSLRLTLEAMAKDHDFDVSLIAVAVESNEEFKTLTEKLEFDRKLFKPHMMKPHMTDRLLGSDLGL
ncbi:hypothetical protein [Pseudomonas amygdali]|uniref:Uncharacterized protein n=2 Tax=Pseudomonas amygdali pv. lachrymans TaxID=53707 RepID=A0ABR5KT29_PSEAV|nr:hypothetical protein [Pseudomonas amygdali]AXH60282.1 hypothetical protein PLA107_034420 [Pseudomonas amygdali pv. lachrymans str. M301315]KPC17671.1 Uncharacterized protein AC499_0873 [Pseudomonas amygdali pv. lachrymans]RMT05915.1 hypothetical protein ALP54_04100 [Pseudomonas amygdali pv. lachrymans]